MDLFERDQLATGAGARGAVQGARAAPRSAARRQGSLSLLMRVLKECTTSAASTGCPSWKRAVGFSRKVADRPPGATVTSSAVILAPLGSVTAPSRGPNTVALQLTEERAKRQGVDRRESVRARLAVKTNSERGRLEYLLVGLVRLPDGGLAAYPMGKGSGSVTSRPAPPRRPSFSGSS